MESNLSPSEANQNPTIVILDDSEADIVLLRSHLKKLIPEALFVTAQSKAELLKKLEWSMPDLIISDYNLPDTNGLEVLLLMKDKFPAIPFVFVTGMLNDEEKTAETILRGADGYILKQNLAMAGEKVRHILNQSITNKTSILAAQALKDQFEFQAGKIKELISGRASHEQLGKEFALLLQYFNELPA